MHHIKHLTIVGNPVSFAADRMAVYPEIAYRHIDRIEFTPSECITLPCGDTPIPIRGRGLNIEFCPNVRLFQRITRHRVPWVAEANPSSPLQAEKNVVVVESIQW
jgi:hypothetical protein